MEYKLVAEVGFPLDDEGDRYALIRLLDDDNGLYRFVRKFDLETWRSNNVIAYCRLPEEPITLGFIKRYCPECGQSTEV